MVMRDTTIYKEVHNIFAELLTRMSTKFRAVLLKLEQNGVRATAAKS
jgi:hypothetical protein